MFLEKFTKKEKKYIYIYIRGYKKRRRVIDELTWTLHVHVIQRQMTE